MFDKSRVNRHCAIGVPKHMLARNNRHLPSRSRRLKTTTIKDCFFEVHSCITPVSVNQVCHDVMFAVCRASIHLTLLLFSVTLSISVVMDVCLDGPF